MHRLILDYCNYQGEAGNEEMDDNEDIGVESGQDMIEDNDRT